MRAVDRAAVAKPPSLCDGATEVERQKYRDHITCTAGKGKPFRFALYKSDDIKEALESLFCGKCAYCESIYKTTAPVDVDHYRPKGSVAECPSHGGYWWIAMEWNNLLPSCIDCNRSRKHKFVSDAVTMSDTLRSGLKAKSGKLDSFPLATESTRAVAEDHALTTEEPLLLNPCVDDPRENFEYEFDGKSPLGVIVPKGNERARRRGLASIAVYGLNRLELVQARTEVLRDLECQYVKIVELSQAINDLLGALTMDELEAPRALKVAFRLRKSRSDLIDEIKRMAADDRPYAAMVREWIRVFKKRIATGDL